MLAGQLEQEQVSVVARLLTPALPSYNACWYPVFCVANVTVILQVYASGGLNLVGDKKINNVDQQWKVQ